MKTTSLIISSLALAVTVASNVALAEDKSVDQSRDVFVARTILGNWKPAVTAVSNEKPSVDSSLGVFSSMVLGKTPRVTEATFSKPIGQEIASQLFTRQFLSN